MDSLEVLLEQLNLLFVCLSVCFLFFVCGICERAGLYISLILLLTDCSSAQRKISPFGSSHEAIANWLDQGVVIPSPNLDIRGKT